jgi:hypothetical protein
VSERDPESPERDLVHSRVVDVVSAVEADDGAECRPGAERAGAQGGDEGGCGAGVDLLGAGEGEVGLDAVAEGDDGDLVLVVLDDCVVGFRGSRGEFVRGAYEEEPLGQETVEGREVGCEGVHFACGLELYVLRSGGCL